MALFIAIQITRTKSYRENLNSSLSQFHQALEHKLQIKNAKFMKNVATRSLNLT